MRWWVGALLGLMGVSTAGCMSSEPAQNVLLVILHGVRADHTTPYGYARDTTPNLARLAEEGTLYEAAYAAANDIRPAMTSLLSGWHPAEIRGSDPTTYVQYELLGSIGQDFRQAGRHTAAYYSSLTGPSALGLSFGFESADRYTPDSAFGSAIQWLGDRRLDGRWLLLMEFGGSVHPYAAPGPFRHLYATCSPFDFQGIAVQPTMADRVWDGNFYDDFPVEMTTDSAGNLMVSPKYARLLEANTSLFDATPIPEAQRDVIVGCYDNTVAYTDFLLGHVLAQLEEQRLLDRTTVVVVSDHGQDLLDHGVVSAVNAPFDGSFRVPFIISGPGWPKGKRIKTPVSMVDLRATLEQDVAFSGESDVSRSLHPSGEGLDEDAVVFAEEVSGHLIARDKGYHLVYDTHPGGQALHKHVVRDSAITSGYFKLFAVAEDGRLLPDDLLLSGGAEAAAEAERLRRAMTDWLSGVEDHRAALHRMLFPVCPSCGSQDVRVQPSENLLQCNICGTSSQDGGNSWFQQTTNGTGFQQQRNH